eukprot:409737_1
MMRQVYQHPVEKRYFCSVLSLAYLTKVVALALMVVVPFLFAYNSEAFWKKEGVIFAQPRVEFTRQIILLVEGADAGSTLHWSTLPEYDVLMGVGTTREPVVRTWSADDNLDGIADKIFIELRLPLTTSETVRSVKLATFYDVSLDDRVTLRMQGLAFCQMQSHLPGFRVDFIGDLNFKQTHPIHVTGQRTVYNTPIVDTAHLTSVKDVLFPTILGNYQKRNETLHYEYPYSVWTPGQDEVLTINMEVNIRKQRITYVPAFAETVKFAWMQYLAMLFVVWYFLTAALRFIFENQLVETSTTVGYVKSLKKLHEY